MAKNFLLGFISVGFFLTIGGFIANGIAGGNWIVVGLVFIAYLLYAIWSFSKGNQHMSPDAAARDFFGDIITSKVSFALALTWTLLGQTPNTQVADYAVFVTSLAFLWGMYAISLIEQVMTINLAAQQLYRIGQVTTESPT